MKAARYYDLLIVLAIGLICLATFTFGRAGVRPDRSLVEAVVDLFTDWAFRVRSPRDFAVNILLYMPFGALMALRQSLARPRGRELLPALAAGTAFSILAEVTQNFIARYPSLLDVIANSAGYLGAFGLFWYATARRGLSAASLIGLAPLDGPDQSLRTTRFLYMVLFVFVRWLPLDLGTTLGVIYLKLRPGLDGSPPKLILDPLYHLSSSPAELHRLLLTAVAFVPVGVFSRLLNTDAPLARAMLTAGALALVTEGGSLFVYSGHTDVIVLPLAVVAAAVGCWAAGRWDPAGRVPRGGVDDSARGWWTVWLLVCLAICLVAWSPYVFEPSMNQALGKLRQLNWMPFRLHFETRSVSAALDIVKEFALFIPFGLAGARAMRKWVGRATGGLVVAVAVTFAAVVETSQAIVVGRLPDVTDVLLTGSGAVLGTLLGLSAFASGTVGPRDR